MSGFKLKSGFRETWYALLQGLLSTYEVNYVGVTDLAPIMWSKNVK